jgi:hypothetical protein
MHARPADSTQLNRTERICRWPVILSEGLCAELLPGCSQDEIRLRARGDPTLCLNSRPLGVSAFFNIGVADPSVRAHTAVVVGAGGRVS